MIIFNCTHGGESPERAILPFVAANVAASAGVDAVVFCTVDAVNLGTEGGTDRVTSEGLPPLSELFTQVVDNGGRVWLCGACTKPRGITEDMLAKGATIVGAAKVVEELASGAQAVSFG